MKVHIVGAGPTGLSLAWEILHSGGDYDVTIYDKKVSAGGSWWEPEEGGRDLHAHRILFDKAFVNFKSLIDEMNIEWDDLFTKVDRFETLKIMFNSLNFIDYITLLKLFIKVYTSPTKYKSVSLKNAIGSLSKKGEEFVEHLTLIMDGVTWNTMSAYEFVKNLDHVGLSDIYTQKVSGRVMCDAMENAVLDAGAQFVFETELLNVTYGEDDFIATFSNELIVDDGLLFLCLDNSPALNMLGDNWGPDADKKLRASTYGAINVLLDYDTQIEIKSDLEVAMETKWNLQPKVLSDHKTISCVICDLTEEIISTNPDRLITEVIYQLGVPEPTNARIGWGAEWKDDKWTFSQSSGVLSLHGQLPFFGKCPKVAMCGMMSPRETPYSSIEAATEVSRSLSHSYFGTRKPLTPPLLSQVLLFILTLLIVLILIYRNRNQ
jgi:hypothetical protein|tara:strand:+ start:615 stop:1916 length:1302 start_codon:yes stop_codon:yes gene_type:complete